MIPVVIPVAGLGTRALPASKAIPKEMFTVFDRPVIQYIVEEAVDAGSDQIIFVNSKGKSSIEDHFDISAELETSLEKNKKSALLKAVADISRKIDVYSVRQKEQLGLGHAILMAKRLINTQQFAVMLGDDMIGGRPGGLSQLVEKNTELLRAHPGRSVGVVLLMEVPEADVSKYGICEISDPQSLQISRCVEKPKPAETKSRFAIIGRYLLPTDIFPIIENQERGALGEIQLTDALNQLAKEGRLFGVTLKGERLDAGDRVGLLKADLYYYLKSEFRAEVLKVLDEAKTWK